MARQCVGCDAEVPGGPCERESGSAKLGFRHNLLIEVSFAEKQEMACRVVVRCCVAGNLGAAQFVDVANAVNGDVIRDVDPSQLVLVVPLILTQVPWGITVVAEDHGLVVEGHTADGVRPPSGAGRSRTPSVSA